MNVLMVVSWYTSQGSPELEAGVFHYEQSMDLKRYCNMALYYPFDTKIKKSETKEEEWGLLTYRSKYRVARMFHNRKQMMKTMDHIVEEFKPDVIHAHCGGGAGFFAIAFQKKYGIPVIVTEHSPVELSGVTHKGYGYILAKHAYKKSKANICVSKDLQKKLSVIFPKYSFDVIYNGIIFPKYNNSTKQYYREGCLNIVIVAVLYDLEIKGMKYLLRAVQLLKKQGRKICLHHIGGGEYLEHFQNMAKELGIEDACVFYGQCDRTKLYEIVNEMDFLVSASLMESGGVSVQEAMLLGKPVLGTNSGGVDSLVPGEAGHIVEKADARALADGIVYMQDHLDSFDREWIKNYAYEEFEISNISRKYFKLYQKIIEES